jgi:L-Lysine epsilon oxidase N-terminal/L-lysine epsilon oxidase C-terminal domain
MKKQPISLTAEQIKRICAVRIHPGIGIARVGNSNQYYIGPEVMQPERSDFGVTRDKAGAIKRQAARFRVYGYDKDGNVVAEIQQSSNSTVKWTVQLANKKAAWYRFDAAMDIPVTKTLTVPLRNADVMGSARQNLIIDTGEKNIMGINLADDTYQMSGEFQGTPVMLGELRTDAVGRLLVLPAKGVSESPTNQPIYTEKDPDTFNNADGWYDDISDGPVNARVTFGDKVFQADSAWVCAAPPNYAPDIIGWRTLDDLLRNLYIQSGLMPLPHTISFNEHVRPILERLNGLQWVNGGFAAMFGEDAPMNFGDKTLMQKLSLLPNDTHSRDTYAELRRTIYNSFRTMDSLAVEPRTWPWIYGDAYGYSDNAASEYLALPSLFDYILQNWVKGNFTNDYDPNPSSPNHLSDIPLQKQPEMLDRANMHFCLADAFHPGSELTWPVRNASMYRAPYRFKVRAAGKDEPSYGSKLDAKIVASMGGPLYEQGAGDLTRWMALPWQADTAFCRSGYDSKYDPYLPTFWPARVPNQVLTEADYTTLCDQTQNMETRIAAFHTREFWTRILPSSDSAPEQMEYMVAHFSNMGIIEALPRPADVDWLPDFIYVENLPAAQKDQLEQLVLKAPTAAPSAEDKALAAAGWASQAQKDMFMRVKRRGR